MAELESENSSDGTLVIDEPNYDYETIEILDSSDSDVEVVELDDNIEETSTLLNPSSSSTNVGLNCNFCFRKFSSNNDLLNHIRKFKGRLGSCINMSKMINVNLSTKRKNEKRHLPEHIVKKKRGRPPKYHPVIKTPDPNSLCPQNIPIIYNSFTPTNNLPSLRKILVDELEREYSCTKCDQTFRHNIGLICHLNSEHNDESNNISLTKLNEKKERKRLVKTNKEIEYVKTITDTIDLTLLPDYKKDSLMNRMKSYVYSPNKGQVICVLCNVEFKNTKKALAHVEDKHITEKIECGYCNMKFVYELKLRSHMAKRHKVISVYKCDKCSKMINNEECKTHSEKCTGKVNLIKT